MTLGHHHVVFVHGHASGAAGCHFGAFFEVGGGVLDFACRQRISSSSLTSGLPSHTPASDNPSMNRSSNSTPCQRSNRPDSANSLARRRTYASPCLFFRGGKRPAPLS